MSRSTAGGGAVESQFVDPIGAEATDEDFGGVFTWMTTLGDLPRFYFTSEQQTDAPVRLPSGAFGDEAAH